MSKKDFKLKISNLVAYDKLEEAIDICKNEFYSSTNFFDEITLIEGIYNKWNSDDRKGLKPSEKIINKVRSSIIELVNKYSKSSFKPFPQEESNQKENTRTKPHNETVNTQRIELNLVDPLVANLTKQKLNEDIEEFKRILNSASDRNAIREFLGNHSYFFNTIFRLFGGCPLFSDIKLGSEHSIDFCYCDTNSFGPDWTFIRIESPTHKMFNKNGDISSDLNHSIRQVLDWQDWIHENISYIRKLMPAIDFPKNYIFIGRREELLENKENARRLKRLNHEYRKSIEIHSLDNFIVGAKSVENLLSEEKGGSWYVPMRALTHNDLSKGLSEDILEWINRYNDKEYREYWTKERIEQRSYHHWEKDGEQLI